MEVKIKITFLFYYSSLIRCRYLLPRLRVVSPVQQLSVPLQHVCCSSCSPSDLASHSSELLSAFFVFLVIFLLFLVWLVLCSRTRYASISLDLPFDYLRLFCFFSVSVCDHIICISLGWRISTDTGCTGAVEWKERLKVKTTLTCTYQIHVVCQFNIHYKLP